MTEKSKDDFEILDKLLRPNDLCRQLMICKPTLLRWLNEGRIIGARKLEGSWVIHPAYRVTATPKQAEIFKRSA
jgi:predicted site-specific integrase-resolvase